MLAPLMAVVIGAAAPAELPLSCNAQAKPLFASARKAIGNARAADAEALLRKALAADPKCVIAKAMLGRVLPDDEGKRLVDEAVAAETAGLTPVEKALLQMVKADRDGEAQAALAAAVRARELAPGVAQLSVDEADHAQALLDWEHVVKAASAATALEPGNAQAWNLLGYGHLGLHQNEQAVTAFTKYVEVAPNEPNAHDSLADALLTSGKLEAAAAEYQKAIDQKLFVSYHGLATVKVIAGDLSGANAAIDGLRATATGADKIQALWWKAALQTIEGKLPEAMRSIDATAAEGAEAKLEFFVAAAPLWRADLLFLSGKFAEAQKALTEAEKVTLDAFSEGQRRRILAWRLASGVQVHVATDNLRSASGGLSKLMKLYAQLPDDLRGKNLIAQGRGAISMGLREYQKAATQLAGCTELFDLCRAQHVEALTKAKDAAGAAKAREALLAMNRRDPGHWLARWKVAAKK